ncbi:MAG: DRTGG domain-containing protein [Chloroflexota bacterium]
MKVAEIIQIVNGTLCNPGVRTDFEVQGAFGADLMSDVLAATQPDAVLLTGLCNPQVVRTAQMADVRAIVFVRGKQPAPETVRIATEEGIPLISSQYGMFELCGRLHVAGLPSLERNIRADCDCEDESA